MTRNLGELSRRPRRHQPPRSRIRRPLQRHRQRRAQHRGRPRRRELRIHRPLVSTGNVTSGPEQHRRRLHRRQRGAPVPQRIPEIGTTHQLGRHWHGHRRRRQHGRPAGRTVLSDRRTTRPSNGALSRQSGGFLCEGTLFNPNRHPPLRPSRQKHPETLAAAQPRGDPVKDTLSRRSRKRSSTRQCGSPGGSGAPGGQKGNQKGGPPGPAARGRPPFGPARYGLGPLPGGMPPLNETRFLSNEVVIQLGGPLSPEALAALRQARTRDHLSPNHRAARPHSHPLPHYQRCRARRDRRDREGARRDSLGRSRATATT